MVDTHKYFFFFAYRHVMKYKLALIIDNREITIINSCNGACLSRHKEHNNTKGIIV